MAKVKRRERKDKREVITYKRTLLGNLKRIKDLT